MKKLILFLVITVSVLISCSKSEEEIIEKEKSASNQKITSVLKEKNEDTQRIMFRLLSKEEKQGLWLQKIENLEKNLNLNIEQTTLLADLKKHLNVEIFNTKENNDAKEVFNNVYVPTFVEKAKKIFGKEFTYNFFYKIGDSQQSLIKPDCQCNVGSYFSCILGVWTCRVASCQRDSSGCGFLGINDCNGICS